MITQRSVVRPRKRLRPGVPRIDWSHPLARGLIACYVPKDAVGGVIRNLAGLGGNLSTVSASATLGMTQDGVGLKDNASSGGATVIAPALFKEPGGGSTNLSVTVFWRGMATANPVTDIIQLIGIRYDGTSPGTSPFVSYAIGRGTGAALDNDSFCAQYASGGGYHSVGFNLAWSSNYGRMYSMSATFVDNGSVTLYLDGAQVATNATTFSTAYTANSTVSLECVAGSTGAIGNVTGTIAGISLKPWTAADHLAWAKNPYGFLVFPEERVYNGFKTIPQITVTVDAAVPTESLRKIVADESAPLDFQATQHVVTSDAAIPIEVLSRVRSDEQAPIEAAQPLPFPLKNFGIPGFCAISGMSVGPPSGYMGPFDLIGGALVGYSMGRALRSAWIGQNLATLRRNGDNATQGFVALPTGKFDQASAATFVAGGGSSALYGNTFNDQSGNALDLVQTGTLGLQPLYTPNTLGGAPILDFSQCTGASTTRFGNMQTASAVSWTPWAGGNFTIFIVCKVPSVADAGGATTGLFFGQTGYGQNTSAASNSVGFQVGNGNAATPGSIGNFMAVGFGDGITPGWFSGPPTYASCFAFANGTTGVTLWSGSYNVHELQVQKPNSFMGTTPFTVGGSSLFLYNGVNTGLSYRPSAGAVEGQYFNATGTTTNYALILGDPNASAIPDAQAATFANGDGQVVELMVWPSLLTTSQRSTIRKNIGNFYGISVTP